MGSGPIPPHTPLVVDIFPRDNASAVYTDMTRTFVVGDVRRRRPRVASARARRRSTAAIAEIRAGVEARALFDVTCDIFEAAGEPTQRTKKPGEPLVDGFFHGLGHGVGLEVHEAPGMGRLASKKLVAGDVVTIEPGLYRAGLRRRPPRGHRPRHRERRRGAHGLPVRPRALTGGRSS